ncbi:MAG: (deoxy)nucleoside triphosphate pyrophosphohydrolase [Acutalibacteraceae bacterium]
MEGRKLTAVSAALIFENGRFLIGRRPANKSNALLWEFIGGKAEPGETGEQALIRECQEEIGVTLSVGEPYMQVVHAYPDITVRLTLYHAAIVDGTPQRLEHAELRWITPGEIPRYTFCPADRAILDKIRQDYA